MTATLPPVDAFDAQVEANVRAFVQQVVHLSAMDRRQRGGFKDVPMLVSDFRDDIVHCCKKIIVR